MGEGVLADMNKSVHQQETSTSENKKAASHTRE